MTYLRAEQRRQRWAESPSSGGSPEDITWLSGLIQRTPLLPEPALRAHWRRILPWLDSEARYGLAATLLAAERELAPGSPRASR